MTSTAQASDRRRSSLVSRRTFLAGLGAASVVAAAAACQPVPPGATGVPVTGGTGSPTTTPTTAPTATAPPKVPTDPFLRSAWAPLVGQAVTLVGAGGTVAAVLDSVDDLGARTADEHSFALAFRAPSAGAVLDQVDAVRTQSAGSRTLLATPIDRDVDHHWYQAIVFNPR